MKPPHPMLYARTRDDGSGFGTQRVVSNDWEVDGGGAVAADGDGNVYVMWHSGPRGSEEKDRRIYLRRSTDDGASFGREQVISPPTTGVCGCCAMQAIADRDGNLYVAYRAAGNNVHRDIILL
ncbi:MAG: sialidase family protein, partial [Gammaproteobacteria bacterium]|nr:sialidase family protein [Gammaproteobacteria bacterium]